MIKIKFRDTWETYWNCKKCALGTKSVAGPYLEFENNRYIAAFIGPCTSFVKAYSKLTPIEIKKDLYTLEKPSFARGAGKNLWRNLNKYNIENVFTSNLTNCASETQFGNPSNCRNNFEVQIRFLNNHFRLLCLIILGKEAQQTFGRMKYNVDYYKLFKIQHPAAELYDPLKAELFEFQIEELSKQIKKDLKQTCLY